MTTPYDALITEIAVLLGLPPDLLQAQVVIESEGDPNAFRYEKRYFQSYIWNKPAARAATFGPFAACSCGLLQILVETAVEHGFTGQPWDLFDPRTGLLWGARYLHHLWVQQGGGDGISYRRALEHYNGSGPDAAAYAVKVYTLAGRPVPQPVSV